MSMDERVLCPLNNNHVMFRKNLQRHLIKCMADYPNHVACAYNALHVFQTKEEMLEHIPLCPSRHLLEVNFSTPSNFNNDPVKINNDRLDETTKCKKNEMNNAMKMDNKSEECWN